MKLVIATPLYPPQPGGPATYAKILEEHFPRPQAADHRADEITLVKWADFTGPKGVRHLRYFFGVLKASRSADAVLALDPVSVGFPAALAAHFTNKAFFVKVVGDFAWEQGTQRFGVTDSLDVFVRRGWMGVRVGILRMIQTYVAHEAHAVIVPSNYLKKIVTLWGIDPEKISVIYNSIEMPAMASSTHVQTSSVSLEVLTVGRLVPWKDIEGIITAVAAIRTTLPKVSLTIVGEGPEKESLQVHAARELADAAVFMGAQSHEKTLAAMKRANVLVLNSTYEGLSHVLIEGLLLGCVIIATDAGGNSELITDEINGLLIPVGDTSALIDALSRVLTQSALIEKLRHGAYASSVMFSVDTMVADTRTLIESTI